MLAVNGDRMKNCDRFDEVAETGQLYFSGCSHIGETNFIGFGIAEGYDDVSDYSAVIVQVGVATDGFQFHLSVDQAESLAGMLREAARQIRLNERIKESS